MGECLRNDEFYIWADDSAADSAHRELWSPEKKTGVFHIYHRSQKRIEDNSGAFANPDRFTDCGRGAESFGSAEKDRRAAGSSAARQWISGRSSASITGASVFFQCSNWSDTGSVSTIWSGFQDRASGFYIYELYRDRFLHHECLFFSSFCAERPLYMEGRSAGDSGRNRCQCHDSVSVKTLKGYVNVTYL